MITVGDGLFSVLVTTMFVTLLVMSGSAAGLGIAVALAACSAYRARCSPLRLTRIHSSSLHHTLRG